MDYKLHKSDIDIQIYERGNTTSNILIVILHGGPGSGAKPLMELSSFQRLEESYHCIYFDQRGSGISTYELRKGLPKELISKDVYDVIQDCKQRWRHKKVILWGGSFGGLLSCIYMECYGDVDGLILSSPAITFERFQALEMFERTKSMMEERLPVNKPETSMKEDVIEPEQVFKDEHFLDFIYSPQNPSNSLRHIAAMSSWFYKYQATNALACIVVPTLLMIGKEDPICDANVILNKVNDIQNSWITSYGLSPCGHAVFEDREDDFICTTEAFINSNF
ncbi:alpha/beta fold hydrolase [Amedibacillus sp. YH-ame10]